MLWVLWDIFVPLLIAFLGGLFVGWLFWRWRRSPVDIATLNALSGNTAEHKNDADSQSERDTKASARLQTAWRN